MGGMDGEMGEGGWEMQASSYRMTVTGMKDTAQGT